MPSRKQSATSSAKSKAAGLATPATVIALSVAALTVLGLAVLFSASLPVDRDEPYRFIEKQAIWAGVTFFVGLAILRIDLEWARKLAWPVYALCLVGLGLVLVEGVGVTVNGSRRWIPLGPVNLQVSEFAKLGAVFLLAHFLGSKRREERGFWNGFVLPCLLAAAPVGLVLMQTDLGTALLLAAVCFCLLFLSGARLLWLVPSALGGAAAAFALVASDPVRWRRLSAFFDLEGDKAGAGYQAFQALLAFGAGGVEGVGLGNGRQQLNFLPEAHNDFIFAIVGEELGLVATLGVVALYATLFVACLLHLRKAPNLYQYLLASGCLLLVSAQALMNLGVVTGVLPTTGLPLPFISYGGSNFLAMGVCVAVLVNTSFAWKAPALKQKQRHLKEIEA